MEKHTSPFHRGEKEIQSRLGKRDQIERLGRKAIRDHLPQDHREFFPSLPFLILGTVDAAGRPWASVLAGEPGFVRAADPGTLDIKARTIYGDPASDALVEGANVGILGIDLQTRARTRANGKVTRRDGDGFAVHVVQSFGNCPKYIQARRPTLGGDLAAIGEKRPVHRGDRLNAAEAALIAGAGAVSSAMSAGSKRSKTGE